MPGTYTLLVRLPTPRSASVGALGRLAFDPGWYAYTGSAFGPGGFSRVERHRETARGERDTRHWHVDYLLTLPGASVADVVRTHDEDVECAVARDLTDAFDGVAGFGCSDCSCATHLVHATREASLRRATRAAHAAHSESGAEARDA